MNLKTATLFAMVCTSLQVLIALGFFLVPPWGYNPSNIILSVIRLVNFATYASLPLFFFSLYTKQQKG